VVKAISAPADGPSYVTEDTLEIGASHLERAGSAHNAESLIGGKPLDHIAFETESRMFVSDGHVVHACEDWL